MWRPTRRGFYDRRDGNRACRIKPGAREQAESEGSKNQYCESARGPHKCYFLLEEMTFSAN